jgi:nicotinamide phosphoribosyltransferase
MFIDPFACTDFYKIGHIKQYPKRTEMVYSNMTARDSSHANTIFGDKFVINFGLQYVIQKFLVEDWNQNFFDRPEEEVVARYERRISATLGEPHADSTHVRALHKLGYLPILIKALPEGARVPVGVPLFTIQNTEPEFFWLTNFLETALSGFLWKPITSATMAYEYRRLFDQYAEETGGDKEFVPFQGHDFSFRGMSNVEDAALSGAAHLTSFVGTDSIIAIDLLEQYYQADVTKGLVGCSVPATEHSVMCMGGELDEKATFERLIGELYPAGIVSIVSDTWDFWKVVTETLPELKYKILERDGKLVIRPDSGDPVNIICGDLGAKRGSPEFKGLIECLWDTFGGETNEKGYKKLDYHIGAIYGDAINLVRAEDIMRRLADKGFTSDNVVLGIGSFTYQYVTRDTHGFAIKSTAGQLDGEIVEIFKDPKTDSGIKKSAKGLLRVSKNQQRKYELHDQQTPDEEKEGELKTVFINGEPFNRWSLEDIRERIANG